MKYIVFLVIIGLLIWLWRSKSANKSSDGGLPLVGHRRLDLIYPTHEVIGTDYRTTVVAGCSVFLPQGRYPGMHASGVQVSR